MRYLLATIETILGFNVEHLFIRYSSNLQDEKEHTYYTRTNNSYLFPIYVSYENKCLWNPFVLVTASVYTPKKQMALCIQYRAGAVENSVVFFNYFLILILILCGFLSFFISVAVIIIIISN